MLGPKAGKHLGHGHFHHNARAIRWRIVGQGQAVVIMPPRILTWRGGKVLIVRNALIGTLWINRKGAIMILSTKRLSILLVCSASIPWVPAGADDRLDNPEIAAKLDAIEIELAVKRDEISSLEERLVELRSLLAARSQEDTREVAVVPTEPTEAKSRIPPGLLADATSLDQALYNPNDFFEKLYDASKARGVAARILNNNASQPIFDRPNLPSGLSAALSLGNASEASINYSYPITLRKVLNSQSEFRPQLATFSASITTPIQSRVGTLLSDTAEARYTRANLDVPTGTRIRLGFDFLSYPSISNRQIFDSSGMLDATRSFAARRRVVDVIYPARDACFKHYRASSDASRDRFYSLYDLMPPITRQNSLPPLRTGNSASPTTGELTARQQEVEDLCSNDKLLEFIVAEQADSTTVSGTALMSPNLARSFLSAFWNAAPTQLPSWGWGLSGEFGTTDFAYRQANSISLVPDAEAAAGGFPGRFNLSVNPAAGFGAPATESRDSWTLRGYGLFSLFRATPERATPAWFFPGITFVGSAEYASAYSFRPGTRDLTICPPQPEDPITAEALNVNVRCRTFNVDAPTKVDGTTFAAEARFRFLNVPLIRTLSIAPRYSYRVDDGAQIIDLPVYLQNDANGFGSAGLRFRHRWGGVDLLGNADFKSSELTVFFVPLRFDGL